ncbi:uncharacterized protein E0L32_005927 [Thyridium curvatum]|uniref:Uncharacterized protein n=1 Tax=Thyridium curvatum TaxID=1093900 RepID=A0A507B4V0_9PEZI|nr:uncharacterized protein E0L32_005927 [Thyridium curvatum]TPX13724.1 hypothetical protein E0L32_005927 [Thyridium curvatum]
MKFSLALLSTVLGTAAAQAVTSKIAPSGAAPSGCATSYTGSFEVTVEAVKSANKAKRFIESRDTCGADGILVMTLNGGVLTDAKGRTGYIASNYQFQFDGPVQAGALYTAGFSLCGNNSLALGSSAVFYQCKSGDFWNLYDRWWAEQCEQVQIIAMPCGSGSGGSGSGNQGGDGQVVATAMVTTTVVKPLGDGQPQVLTTAMPVPMCQIGDGQVQAHTTPCAQVPAKPAVTSAVPVSQIHDGQIQIPPSAPAVTQIGDGQVQVPPASAPPATTAAPPAPAPPAPAPSKNASQSTLATVPAAPTQPAAGTTSPASVPTAGVARVELGSAAAVALGIVGAMMLERHRVSSTAAFRQNYTRDILACGRHVLPSCYPQQNPYPSQAGVCARAHNPPHFPDSHFPPSRQKSQPFPPTMAEYWKSTPKYWCKHCSIYVRDTKLERANHEATGKHQGAVKRALRDLHRGHEQAEREKERAKREIDRLNGVYAPRPGGPSSSSSSSAAPKASRQEQLEQLASLGVNIPEEMRSDLALAGEWKVTATRVVPDEAERDEADKAVAAASGVRKRELEKTEEEQEHEEAMKGLFKKQRRWGRDSRTAPGEGEGDDELDVLLSGGLLGVKKEAKKEDFEVKKEDGEPQGGSGAAPEIKRESVDEEEAPSAEGSKPVAETSHTPDVKAEEGQATDAPAVVFKKRKPKNVRQR